MPRKTLTGTVLRVAHPTARVRVDRMVRHPVYEKQYRRSTSYLVHIPGDLTPSVGDMVELVPTPPRSKRKHWEISTVLTQQK